MSYIRNFLRTLLYVRLFPKIHKMTSTYQIQRNASENLHRTHHLQRIAREHTYTLTYQFQHPQEAHYETLKRDRYWANLNLKCHYSPSKY